MHIYQNLLLKTNKKKTNSYRKINNNMGLVYAVKNALSCANYAIKPTLRFLAVLMVGLTLAACKAELYGNLSERQVNEMILVLGEEGIEATRKKTELDNYALYIDRSDFVKAISILSSRGLPGSSYESLGEVFKSDKIVSTPFEERARFMYALNQELAHSITQIEGVVSSRVHITIPEEAPFSDKKQSARASIFIYQAKDADISQYVPVIKNLVTRSVEGLTYENVTVAIFNAQSNEANITGKQEQQSENSPSPVISYISFFIFALLAFFVLSRLIWKPTGKIPEPEYIAKPDIKKSPS